MLNRGALSPISLMLAGGVLVYSSPAMAQSPGILASAERFLTNAELVQDDTFVQRRRSMSLAATGAVLAAAGAVLVLQPPKCSLEGPEMRRIPHEWEGAEGGFDNVRYDVIEDRGYCDLRAVYESFYGGEGPPFGYVLYESEGQPDHIFPDQTAVTNRTLNHIGWAAMGAGGALVWFGLSRVEVPFRVDMGNGGRISFVRSFSW